MKAPNYNIIILFLIIAFPPLRGFSQETSIYHNYLLSPFIINPAIAGSEYYPGLEVSLKKQWAGVSSAPGTILIAGNIRIGAFDFYNSKGLVNKGAIKVKDRIGIGAAVFADQNGPLGTIGGMLSYAYHVPLNTDTRLSFGLSFLSTYYSFNNAILKPDMPGDSYLFSENEGRLRANFNFGTYYYNNRYFTGISITKILPDMAMVNDNIEMQPSFFLMGGYKFFKDKPNNLEQTVTIKRIGGDKTYLDLLTKLYVMRLNWIAVSYSTSGKMNVLFGLNIIKMLYAGYNYEYTFGNIATYNNGSHTIYLGINLGLIKVDNIRKTVK